MLTNMGAGTVISVSASTDVSFTGPISARLHQRDTGLRATADPSLLVQSLLDLSAFSRSSGGIEIAAYDMMF